MYKRVSLHSTRPKLKYWMVYVGNLEQVCQSVEGPAVESILDEELASHEVHAAATVRS